VDHRFGRVASLIRNVQSSERLAETHGEEGQEGEEDGTLAHHTEGDDLERC
jgi:hypothetical protein